VSAHGRAHTQVRPYKSFSYFFFNLIYDTLMGKNIRGRCEYRWQGTELKGTIPKLALRKNLRAEGILGRNFDHSYGWRRITYRPLPVLLGWGWPRYPPVSLRPGENHFPDPARHRLNSSRDRRLYKRCQQNNYPGRSPRRSHRFWPRR
jgi:hypothetical protein